VVLESLKKNDSQTQPSKTPIQKSIALAKLQSSAKENTHQVFEALSIVLEMVVSKKLVNYLNINQYM